MIFCSAVLVGIYKITSPSGKIYIGQSWNIKKRLSGYKILSASKKQRLLNRSFVKYGYENHNFEIIKVFENKCTQKELDRHEIFYIYKYRSLCFKLLNLTIGGKGGKGTVREKRVSRHILYDLYINKNHTKVEISKIVNQKERLIKKYLKEYNIRKPHNLKVEKDRKLNKNSLVVANQSEALRLKTKQYSIKKISEVLNIPTHTVTNIVTKYNLSKKQKFSFKRILDVDSNQTMTLKEICSKYKVKESCLKEQFRLNRLKFNLKLI